MKVMVTGAMRLASDTPMEPTASAQPRFLMNHLVMVGLMTVELKRFHPSRPARQHRGEEHPEVGLPAKTPKAGGGNEAPTMIRKRGPCLSTMTPAYMPESPPPTAASEVPSVNCHTCQPRSSTTGLRNTPAAAWLAPIQANRHITAPPTIHQP